MKPIEAHSTARIKAKLTREEQAAHELGNTGFAPGTRVALVVVFLAVIVFVPLAQLCAAFHHPDRITRLTAGLRALVPEWARVKAVNGMVSAANLLPPSSQIKKVEDDWEQDSVVGEALLPRVQLSRLGVAERRLRRAGEERRLRLRHVQRVEQPCGVERMVRGEERCVQRLDLGGDDPCGASDAPSRFPPTKGTSCWSGTPLGGSRAQARARGWLRSQSSPASWRWRAP